MHVGGANSHLTNTSYNDSIQSIHITENHTNSYNYDLASILAEITRKHANLSFQHAYILYNQFKKGCPSRTLNLKV